VFASVARLPNFAFVVGPDLVHTHMGIAMILHWGTSGAQRRERQKQGFIQPPQRGEYSPPEKLYSPQPSTVNSPLRGGVP